MVLLSVENAMKLLVSGCLLFGLAVCSVNFCLLERELRSILQATAFADMTNVSYVDLRKNLLLLSGDGVY